MKKKKKLNLPNNFQCLQHTGNEMKIHFEV